MKLIVSNQTHARVDTRTLHRLMERVLREEGISLPCAVSLTLTDDEGIRAINREQRGIDRQTDVLSFPTVAYPAGTYARQNLGLLQQEWDSEVASCWLGDIIISSDQVTEQARLYGHSQDRELGYLLVHGLLHLLGYDHTTAEEKQTMRAKEELALGVEGLGPVDDEALIAKARAALLRAYAPYSGYRVGAALLTRDGQVFEGCNVENASYGLTNCGERSAVFSAVSQGEQAFEAIAIAAESFPPWPCGACRQVLAEFNPRMRVLISWGEGEVARTTMDALLPHGFTPDSGAQDALGKTGAGDA